MIDHYNAFISYKHAPEDNKVAETVQQELERFHIPLKIRKQTGIKRINRIFRDKNELPITSDLTETISNALENSDFLIVICSTNTKESLWVPREIEYFLRNHSINQVLTVLVNGEPNEVIPEILTRDVEPLSCDYRMPIRKANKIELPRLASALIGCSYDELMNRRRQYLMRRVIFGFSAILLFMALFSGYMLYSRNQVRENYIKSLRNQSRYLSNESKNMLENEQRITALLLALEALPKDKDDDRPIIPEAVNALSKAVLAYESNTPNSIHNQWNYTIKNRIDTFKVSPNGASLAALDTEDQVYLWDTTSHEIIMSTSKDLSRYHSLSYISYDKLLIWGFSNVKLIDTTTGSILWEYEDNDMYLYEKDPVLIEDQYVYLLSSNKCFKRFDISNGELADDYKITGLDEVDYITSLSLSPDKTKLGLTISYGYTSEYAVGIYDLNKKQMEKLDGTYGYIPAIAWLDDNKLVFSDLENTATTSMRFKSTSVVSNDITAVHCIDINDSSEVWKSEFVSNNISTYSGFFYNADQHYLYYYAGNTSTIFNSENGDEVCTYNVNSSIVYAGDISKDGYPTYITEDGNVCMPLNTTTEASIAKHKYFTDSIKTLDVNNGFYINKYDSNEIIYYKKGVYDTNWKPLVDDMNITDMYSSFLNDDLIAITSAHEKDLTLTCFILSDGFKVQTFDIPDKQSFDCEVIGYWKNCAYLVTNEDTHLTLMKADMSTGNIESQKLTDSFIVIDKIPELMNGKLLYTYDEGAKTYLAIYDLDTGETTPHEIPLDYNSLNIPIEYSEESNDVYISSNIDILFNLKTAESTTITLPEKWDVTSIVAPNKSGELYAVSDENSVAVIDRKGTPVYSIKPTGVPIRGVAFYENTKSDDEDLLIILYEGGTISRYTMKDGLYRGSSEITYGNYYEFTCGFEFDYENKSVYIRLSDNLDIIDTTTWSEVTSINNCLGHHNPTDRFFTYSSIDDYNAQIGYFERYSTMELIEKAKEMVGDSELTEEQKAKYGIED